MVFGRRSAVDADGRLGGHATRQRASESDVEVAIRKKPVLFGRRIQVLDVTESNDDEADMVQYLGESDRRQDPSSKSRQEDQRQDANDQIDTASVPSSREESPPKQQEEIGTSWFGGWFGTSESPAATSTNTKPKSSDSGGAWSWFGGAPEKANSADDDESLAGSTVNSLFGDLNSLPSVNGEVTISGASLRSTDFDGRDDRSMGRDSVVERKLNEITVKKEYRENPVDLASKLDSAEVHNRRQLLVKELRSTIVTDGRYDVKCASISAALAELLDQAGEHDQAIKLFRDAVAIYSVKLGDDDDKTNEAKVGLAKILSNTGDHLEAISILYTVVCMRKASKGDKDPSVGDALALMAHSLRLSGDYQQAIKELKRGLKIYRETLGDSHESVAKTVDEIASLYVTLGDFEKSSAILEEVVKLKASTLGMKSTAVAETLTNLAMSYECSEQFVQAMKCLKKAYKIHTDIGGYSSEEATGTLNKIALLYEATGDFNRASIAYLGVLRGRKIIHGESHLKVGEIYCRLGHALRETGQLEKALKCMKEALPVYVGQGVEMEDVEKIAEIMHEMALIYKQKKHHAEAARIFKQELSVRRKINQPEFPFVARTLNHLGVTEYEMKNNSKALKYLVEALTIFQDNGEHGMDCAEVLYNTGLVFVAVRNKERALEAFIEAEKLFTEHGCDGNHPFLVHSRSEITRLRASQGSWFR